jgi:hypothetical protein
MRQASQVRAGNDDAITVADAAGAVQLLVESLERLEARIHRDLNAETQEASQIPDPAWAKTLREFTAYAEECMNVLDDERVLTLLDQYADVQPAAAG